jgi:hypothetical protein
MPGVLGTERSMCAIYPWSTVKLLISSWGMDREVASGPAAKNTDWQDWSMRSVLMW